MARKAVIIGSVVAGVAVAGGLVALIWWLVARGGDVTDPARFHSILLEGKGIGNVKHRAGYARIPENGDMFWWLYPTLANNTSDRPILLWLDGVTGMPPSLMANFGMFGPFDFNMNTRADSWIDQYNLLFVDAPLGAGFSTIQNNKDIPMNLESNTEHLLLTIESFYSQNEDLVNTPLYIFGEGYGAQLALSLALALSKTENLSSNLKGIVLGNPIISPAVTLTHLGFYMEELGYVDANGRAAIENYSNNINQLVNQGHWEEAFDNFLGLGEFINKNSGAVAVNLKHIIDKLTLNSTQDTFLQQKYLRDVTGANIDFEKFMNENAASALGISDPNFDSGREDILQRFRGTFMMPATNKVEEILESTNITVTIYNGNLDAVSNTPGQLEWINNLQWSGQGQFLNSSRQTLTVNMLVEGHYRETDRLKFYWMNAAGLSVPLDSPLAMRRVIQRIMN